MIDVNVKSTKNLEPQRLISSMTKNIIDQEWKKIGDLAFFLLYKHKYEKDPVFQITFRQRNNNEMFSLVVRKMKIGQLGFKKNEISVLLKLLSVDGQVGYSNNDGFYFIPIRGQDMIGVMQRPYPFWKMNINVALAEVVNAKEIACK